MTFKERCLVLVVVAVSLLAMAGCGGGQDALEKGSGGGSNGFVVGSANFPEQLILGNMYADVVEDQGVEVERRLNLGTRDVVFPALESGELTLVPEYNGALLSYLSKGKSDVTSSEETTKNLKAELPKGLIALQPSEAQDKDALVVTQETAKKYDLKTTSDLAPVADKLVLGGPPEMSERPDGVPGLKRVYGIEFEEFKPLDAGGSLTTEALANGDIDVGRFFTSQGLIDARGWVVLDDDKDLSPAQNIIPIIRKQDSSAKIDDALNRLSATLTTEDLVKLNRRVEVDKEDPEVVAKDYLEQKGLLGNN
jgi:osmoprotectant transport system substrate-binding protein